MPLSWNNQPFSEQAQYILDMFDGLTEEDIEFVYKEWEKGEYPDSLMGRTEALADLQMIAHQRLLEKCGKKIYSGVSTDELYETWRRGQK